MTNTVALTAPVQSAAGASAASDLFDATGRWQCSRQVGLRPEPFGALAYHFETRRLVFLKSPTLVKLVEALTEHDSAAAAIEAVVRPDNDRTRQAHMTALASLAEAGVIEPAGAASAANPAPSSPATSTPAASKIAFVG